MKTIVEELELIPVTPQETVGAESEPEYIQRAQSLGFSSVRLMSKKVTGITNLPYPEITDGAIKKMLFKRIEEMNRDQKGWSAFRNKDTYQCAGAYNRVEWIETPLDKYEGFPPKHVLTSLDKAKNTAAFERFAIVTVEQIVDPLLIGITADGRRALIDHWGEDLTPDEIISLVD